MKYPIDLENACSLLSIYGILLGGGVVVVKQYVKQTDLEINSNFYLQYSTPVVGRGIDHQAKSI
jgi:hypothetical protein